MPTMQRVHIRINDAATDKPTACRLRFTDEAGVYHAPYGRLTDFHTGRNQEVGGNISIDGNAFAYVDGAFEIDLPPGQISVAIEKGPEYIPQQITFEQKLGKMSQRFALERWTNFRDLGWYSGDTRVHFLPPHAALLEAEAEDVAVVNLLAVETESAGSYNRLHRAVPNLLAFSGQQPALQSPGHMVVVNTQNSHPELGNLGLLNCHRIVFPLSFGGPDGKEDWSLADWCEQCHRKNGLVVWTKPWQEGQEFRYGEPLANAILGNVDAFEIDFYEDSPLDVLADWYRLLNAGVFISMVGGSGKNSNAQSLGCMRTYAQINDGESLTYTNWIEALRSGRVFVTNSPLLSFTVNGCGVGSSVTIPEANESISIDAKADSWLPFDTLELIVNGEVVDSATPNGSPCTAQITTQWKPSETQWLAIRCRGKQEILQSPANHRIFAHSGPIYVDIAGEPFTAKREALSFWQKHLHDALQWVKKTARCDNDKQRNHLAGIFENAIAVVEKRILGV